MGNSGDSPLGKRGTNRRPFGVYGRNLGQPCYINTRMTTASIDLSLRSTGICITDEDGTLIEYQLVSNPTEKNEELVIKNTRDIIRFLKNYDTDLKHIVIEGLAYMGVSASKDLIAGNFWNLRCILRLTFPDIPVTIVPVTEWRKLYISKERAKELKESFKELPTDTKEEKKAKKNLKTDWQKKECVRILPEEMKAKFLDYIEKLDVKKESIYDLTDAYFIGQWSVKEKI